MDTTKQYIDMCNKAKEIQELWKPKEGDFYKRAKLKYGDEVVVDIYGYADPKCNIFIPRQDQLQEMLGIKDLVLLITKFQLWIFRQQAELLPKSMEQLWLAYVMKEKYNKIWNGHDWEREEK